MNTHARRFLLSRQASPLHQAMRFYNWFKKCAIKAGVQAKLGPHGLSKAAARRLAEAGYTSSEIEAITGHNMLSEVERYTREANQKLLAESAWKKLGSMSPERSKKGMKKERGVKTL